MSINATAGPTRRFRGEAEIADVQLRTAVLNMAIFGLAAFLFVAPWLFGTTGTGASSWNAWIVSVAVIWLALFMRHSMVGRLYRAAAKSPAVSRFLGTCRPAYHSAIGTIAVSIWLFVSPWVLGFSTLDAAARPAWIISVLLIALAGWKAALNRRELAEAHAQVH